MAHSVLGLGLARGPLEARGRGQSATSSSPGCCLPQGPPPLLLSAVSSEDLAVLLSWSDKATSQVL